MSRFSKAILVVLFAAVGVAGSCTARYWPCQDAAIARSRSPLAISAGADQDRAAYLSHEEQASPDDTRKFDAGVKSIPVGVAAEAAHPCSTTGSAAFWPNSRRISYPTLFKELGHIRC